MAGSTPERNQMLGGVPMFESQDTVRGTMRLQTAGEPVLVKPPTTPVKTPVVVEVKLRL